MLSYLEKYNNLPKDLKDKVSSPDIMKNIGKIEKEYELSLAVIIMRVMVKEISMVDLAKFFVFEHGLDGARAGKLVDELKEKVFYDVFRYLDIDESNYDLPKATKVDAGKKEDSSLSKKKKVQPVQSSNFFFSSDDEEEIKTLTKKLKDFKITDSKDKKAEVDNTEKIKAIIAEASLSFSSEEMNDRFWKIVDIYLKKVRNKLDTKQTMTKLISLGGLGISDGVADKILAITDRVSMAFDSENQQKEVLAKKVKAKQTQDMQAEEALRQLEDDLTLKPKPEPAEVKLEDAVPLPLKEDSDVVQKINNISGGDVEYDFNKLKEKADDVEDILEPFESKVEPLNLKEAEEHLENNDLEADLKKNVEIIKEKQVKQFEAKKLSKDKLVIEAEQGNEEIKKSDDGLTALASEEEMVLDLKKSGNDKKSVEAKVLNSNIQSTSAENKSLESAPVAGVKIGRSISTVPVPDGKIKMEDVKYVPKLMGPIDELREMNLINFRRLSQDPVEAVNKIEEKIRFLEEDRYSKRIEGIKAWRESPVNTLYLEIGQEGIIVARGIENAIKAREKSKKDYLTLPEFNAIMDLNKRIRY